MNHHKRELTVFIAVVFGVVFLAATAWGQEPSWPTTECSDRVPELTPTCGRRYVEAHPNEPGKLFDVSVVAKWCQENPPWGGSRYRLEKNEITGRLRITVRVKKEWEELKADYWVEGNKIHYITESEMIGLLENLRKTEAEENAWKPIR